MSRTGDHYRESQDRANNFKKTCEPGSMKILRVDLQKAEDNIKKKIEGYPRVERENTSTNQRKNQNLVFEHMIRRVNVSRPPSPRLNTGKEGMIAG